MILVSIVLHIPVGLLGQDDNFAVSVFSGCIADVLFPILSIVLFMFYWDTQLSVDVV